MGINLTQQLKHLYQISVKNDFYKHHLFFNFSRNNTLWV
jgi:hypothetical protein